MIAAWLRSDFKNSNGRGDWLVYPETAGWDLLLAHRDGYQIGVEAKLSLNAKVLAQALVGSNNEWRQTGPDYRAVLVPEGKCQHHMIEIAAALGVRVLTVHEPDPSARYHAHYFVSLPNEASSYGAWPNWLPERRCELPDYIPDVEAGTAAPVMLTPWKVKAIKLLVILQRRGHVTRADMRALQISPTRWTDHYNGFLARSADGYVACAATPDLRVQHPRNWAEIEADADKWATAAGIEGWPVVGADALSD